MQCWALVQSIGYDRPYSYKHPACQHDLLRLRMRTITSLDQSNTSNRTIVDIIIVDFVVPFWIVQNNQIRILLLLYSRDLSFIDLTLRLFIPSDCLVIHIILSHNHHHDEQSSTATSKRLVVSAAGPSGSIRVGLGKCHECLYRNSHIVVVVGTGPPSKCQQQCGMGQQEQQ
jgi:hypothetical protein